MAKKFLIVLKNVKKCRCKCRKTADVKKTASKRAIQKSAEATGHLIGHKFADKITSVSKKPSNNDDGDGENVDLTIHKKGQISPEKRQQIINELRLVTEKD